MVVILVIPSLLKDSTLYLSDGVAQAFLHVGISPLRGNLCKVILELKMLWICLRSLIAHVIFPYA